MGEALAGGSVLAWLTALSVYDIRRRRLPNVLTLPGAAAVHAAALLYGRGTAAVTGALALFGVYLLVHLISPGAMGAGDVKLALGVGGLTGAFGADVWATAAVTAPVASMVWAVLSVIRFARAPVPHGFSMCLTSGLAVAAAIT